YQLPRLEIISQYSNDWGVGIDGYLLIRLLREVGKRGRGKGERGREKGKGKGGKGEREKGGRGKGKGGKGERFGIFPFSTKDVSLLLP
ncbi:hypothetical protein, partial [Nostoc linckia]|uniref:hypothetical protein n=1 Tax=Nostoc linckia TaxID=92942 RepID=UPI000BFFF30F